MTLNNKPHNPIIKGNDIDWIALATTIWNERRLILYSTIICVAIGLIIAVTSPKKYIASATLLPSAEEKGANLGNISALAGMAGINIGNMLSSTNGIPAELYPQVAGSVPYLMELMNEKLNWEKQGEISLYDKALQDTVPSTFAKINKYTFALPWTIMDAIFAKKTTTLDFTGKGKTNEFGDVAIYSLDKIQLKVISQLKNSIYITHDKKSGLVTLSISMGEPVATAQLTNKAVTLLQKSIVDYKTRQSLANLKFIQERFTEAKLRYEQAQRSFFNYKDAHRNIISERIDTEYQRLSDNYDIATTIYKGLAQQQEQAKITVKEETPVFKVLDPVVVPSIKSAPKRGMIIGVSLFIGVILGIGSIISVSIFKIYFTNVK